MESQAQLQRVQREEQPTRAGPFVIELVKKSKKNEPKVFPHLLTVDREAFDKSNDSVQILKTFWRSAVNLIIVAKKADTSAIVGYAAFLITHEGKGCYLMRIAVRSRCQRQGIGRHIMSWLLSNHPASLELDVSTDNDNAIGFY